MASISDMASKGKANYKRKIDGMRSSYAASESRAKKGYDATPFGPTRKKNYKSAWTVMPGNYNLKVKAGVEDKWARNWEEKMKE